MGDGKSWAADEEKRAADEARMAKRLVETRHALLALAEREAEQYVPIFKAEDATTASVRNTACKTVLQLGSSLEGDECPNCENGVLDKDLAGNLCCTGECGCIFPAGTTKLEDPAEKDLIDDEMINHPSHYNNGSIECIDYIEDQELNYHAGCAVKYIARYRFKGTPVKDLRKASWYLLRLANRLEAKEK